MPGARLFDYAVRDHVRLAAGHAGPYQLLGGQLGGEDDVVNLLELVVGLANIHRARQVRHVPVEVHTHVDDDAIAVPDDVVAWLGVR